MVTPEPKVFNYVVSCWALGCRNIEGGYALIDVSSSVTVISWIASKHNAYCVGRVCMFKAWNIQGMKRRPPTWIAESLPQAPWPCWIRDASNVTRNSFCVSIMDQVHNDTPHGHCKEQHLNANYRNPGLPWQNGRTKSFNSRFSDEYQSKRCSTQCEKCAPYLKNTATTTDRITPYYLGLINVELRI